MVDEGLLPVERLHVQLGIDLLVVLAVDGDIHGVPGGIHGVPGVVHGALGVILDGVLLDAVHGLALVVLDAGDHVVNVAPEVAVAVALAFVLVLLRILLAEAGMPFGRQVEDADGVMPLGGARQGGPRYAERIDVDRLRGRVDVEAQTLLGAAAQQQRCLAVDLEGYDLAGVAEDRDGPADGARAARRAPDSVDEAVYLDVLGLHAVAVELVTEGCAPVGAVHGVRAGGVQDGQVGLDDRAGKGVVLVGDVHHEDVPRVAGRFGHGPPRSSGRRRRRLRLLLRQGYLEPRPDLERGGVHDVIGHGAQVVVGEEAVGRHVEQELAEAAGDVRGGVLGGFPLSLSSFLGRLLGGLLLDGEVVVAVRGCVRFGLGYVFLPAALVEPVALPKARLFVPVALVTPRTRRIETALG